MKCSWQHKSVLRSLCGERGAAFIEFAIAAPLMLLLIFSTFEVGRAYRNVTLLSQGTYNAALAGGTVPQVTTETAASTAFGTIFDLRDTRTKDQVISPNLPPPIIDTAAKTIQVSYSEGISSIVSNMMLGVKNVGYVGPMLSKSTPAASTFDQFGSAGNGCWYDCSNVKHCSGAPNSYRCVNGQPYNPPPTPDDLCLQGRCVPGLCDENCAPNECIIDARHGKGIKTCLTF